MKERIEFHKNECKSVGKIGILLLVVGFIVTFLLSEIVSDAFNYGVLMLLIGAGLIIIGVPYYGLKVVNLRRQLRRNLEE